MYITDELMADAYDFNMVQEILAQFTRAIGDEEDKVITAGTGTAQPTGLTQCTITNVACSGNLSFDNMINLEYALPAQYRNAAKNVFLVHPNNVREMRKLKDSNNRYYWSEPVAAGQPASYHGYPVLENSWLPESEIYFGDFKLAYWLGDRQLMTVKTTQETTQAWTKDMIGIRVVERIAGNCVLENALRCLNGIP